MNNRLVNGCRAGALIWRRNDLELEQVDYDTYKTLRTERSGRVLTVALNRGDGLNSVDLALHEELARIFIDLQNDRDIDIVVLTGAGRAFSAGGDLPLFRDAAPGHDEPEFLSRVDAKRIIYSLLDLEKPIIAKINGPAVGLGATIALFCDVIFAAESAFIADPHVSVGIVAGDGGAIIWPQLIGYARAKEFLLTGDRITAAEAARIGLINHAVPDGELDQRVTEFADRLAAGPQKALRWTKVSVNIALKQLAHSMLDTSLAYEWLTFESQDHREAVNAFLEKRQPGYTGG